MTLSYSFGTSTPAFEFIDRAFQNCGIDPSFVTGWQLESCFSHINLILSHWVNLGLPLPFVRFGMLQTLGGQNWYQLPNQLVDILEMNQANVTPIYGGVASSSSGTAANAFNGNPLGGGCVFSNTDTVQTLEYNYSASQGTSYPINVFGVQIGGNNPLNLTLALESSLDGNNWTTILQTPTTTYYPIPNGITNTSLFNIYWNVNVVSVSAPYWRIRETQGAVMNIAQCYFGLIENSPLLGRFSRSEYMGLTDKTTYPGLSANYSGNPPVPGIQSTYYINREVNPSLYIWPTPTLLTPYVINTTNPPSYLTLYFSYKTQLQNVWKMTDTLPIPQRFFKAFIDILALELSKDFAPDKVSSLTAQAASSFQEIQIEDGERVPIRVSPIVNGYGYGFGI